MIGGLLNFLQRSSRKRIAEGVKDAMSKKGYYSIDNVREEDVFIVGFPKSGNTWMQHMVTGLCYGADMSRIHNNLVRELTPDEHQTKFYKRYNEVMCFKSHALPSERYKRVIYLVRDGRDAVVSLYHMLNGKGKSVTFDDIVRNNKGVETSWHDHVQAWLRNPHNAQILYVRYEDMKENPLSVLQKVAGFINVNVESSLLEKISANCSFGNMRLKEESKYWEKANDWKKGEYFVRKGQIGSFKTDFPQQTLSEFESQSAASLKKFNYL